MTTRLVHLVVDATDPERLARFWAAALGWEVAAESDGEWDVWPEGYRYPDPVALPLVFVPVAEGKTGKNRVHLDLAASSPEHQAAEVERLCGLGARRADVGQGDVPWVVLADPEGNEFCVLDPRPVYRDTGPVAAVVADCANPAALAAFWELGDGGHRGRLGGAAVTARRRALSRAAAGPGCQARQEPDPSRCRALCR
jgi:hypothetical protein